VRTLVIEDNPKMAMAIQSGLQEHGMAVDVSHTGYEGEELAASEPYDAIVLDLMLPDRDGVEVCRNLRRRGVQAPVLMLTALSGTQDKVNGLDAGADDYLAKPFEFEELLARLRALMRRGQASESRILRCDDLELDLYSHVATRAGEKIELSNREFALLECLMRNENRVLSRIQIGEKVWDMNFEPTSNVIDVYISALRKKIDRGFDRPLIHTIKGAGYRFGVVDEPDNAVT
jgi:two-component system copper resistance phosphate regulon response regulator CusR